MQADVRVDLRSRLFPSAKRILMNRNALRLGLGLAIAVLVATTKADEVRRYGQRILGPEKPSADAQAAIADLRDFLGRLTGAEFTATDSASANDDRPAIVLARTTESGVPEGAVAALRGKSSQAFCLWPAGSRLWFVSASDAGLSHAASYYLERLGVRWYAPTERWTIVPYVDDLRLDRPLVESPEFTCRAFFGTGGFGGILPCDPQRSLQAAWTTWQRRNRFGGEFAFGGHTGEAFNTKHKSLLESHPEYLAELNGKRVPWSLTAKLCSSNPEVRRLYVEDRLAALRLQQKLDPTGPRSRIVSVEPADGGGHCTCAECVKLGSVSDRVFQMANIVARAVRDVQPDGMVNLYGYHEHAAPPKIDLEPNVFVLTVPYGFQRTDLSPEQLLSAWGKKTKHLGVYDYWSIPDWTLDQPKFDFLNHGPQRLRFWREAGVESFSSESTFSTGAMGPAWYLLARLAWNPQLDERALFADYCRDCFGPAAEPMQRMLTRWSQGYFATSHELALSFRDVDAAWRLVADRPDCERRVADMGRYVEYLRLRFEYQQASPQNDAKYQAALALMAHGWNIYDSTMVHAYRLSQLLARDESAKHPEVLARYDSKNPDAPGWRAIAPPTDADVRGLITAGIERYEPQQFTPQRYDGRPQRLPGNVAKPAEEYSPIFIPASSQTLVVAAGKDERLRLRVAAERELRVTVFDEAGDTTFIERFEGDPQWTERWHDVSIPFAATGVYRVAIWSPKRTFRFSFGNELPVSLDGWVNSQGRPTPRLFFFVPRNVDRVAAYTSYTPAGPPRFFDPTGTEVKPMFVDGGKLMLFDVPPEHRGTVWSLDRAKCPNEPLQMLNVPGLFAFDRASLLVPSDALNAASK